VTEVTAAATRPGAGGPGRPGEVVARLSPIKLPLSSQVRLGRLHPRAILKEDVAQLVIPMPGGRDLAERLVKLLEELLPTPATS
jgi:hypothetical protein